MATFFLPDGPSCNTSAAQPAQPATVGAPTQPVLCDFFQCNVWSSEKGGFLVGHCGLLRSWEYMPVKGQCAAGQKWEGLVRQMEVGEQVTLGYDTMLTRCGWLGGGPPCCSRAVCHMSGPRLAAPRLSPASQPGNLLISCLSHRPS